MERDRGARCRTALETIRTKRSGQSAIMPERHPSVRAPRRMDGTVMFGIRGRRRT
jgi:hypothetical protein